MFVVVTAEMMLTDLSVLDMVLMVMVVARCVFVVVVIISVGVY
jgi:hypothetical protein